MADIQLQQYRISQDRLYLVVNNDFEEDVLSIKLKNSKNNFDQLIDVLYRKNDSSIELSISMKDVDLTGISNGNIDIYAILSNGVSRRLVLNNAPSKENYGITSYKVDDRSDMFPYITKAGILALTYGNSIEIRRPFVKIFESKVTIDELFFEGNKLYITVPNSICTMTDQTYITLIDRKEKNVTILSYTIIHTYEKHTKISIDMGSEWLQDHRYDLFIQEIIGKKIRKMRVGIINYEVEKGQNKYYATLSINSKLKILPYVTTNGEFSFFAGDSVSVDKARGHSLIRNTVYYNELIDSKGEISIKLRELPEIIQIEQFNAVYLLKKSNKEVYIEIDDASIRLNECNKTLSIDLDGVFTHYEDFNINEEWLLVLKLHVPGKAEIVSNIEEALAEVSSAVEDIEVSWLEAMSEEENIVLFQFVKHANWRQEEFERYRHPRQIESGLNIIPFESEQNVMMFLVGDWNIYREKVYTTITSLIDIEDLEIEGSQIQFRIQDWNLINEHTVFTLRDRKSKEEWNVPYSVLTDQIIQLNISDFIEQYADIESRWDMYLRTEYADIIEEGRVGLFSEPLRDTNKRYYPALSKTKVENENHKEIDHSEDDDDIAINVVAPYLTLKNEISIVIRPLINLFNEKLKSKVSVEKFIMRSGVISLNAVLQLPDCNNYTISSMRLKLRNKATIVEYDIPAEESKRSKNTSHVSCVINLDNYSFIPLYWDLFIIVNIDGEEVLVKLKNPSDDIVHSISNKIIEHEHAVDGEYMVYPYITLDKSLSFCYRERAVYETRFYKFKENMAYWVYRLLRKQLEKRDIWLGYEKNASTAQDNGYYFFEYCYENKKHDHFYYIIKEDAADYKDLLGKKNRIIKFMSFKYMVYMYAAKLLVSSESKGHSYDIRIKKGRLKKALDQKKFVFLQHGVIALKKIDNGVFKKTKHSGVDLFVVSSDYEKDIITNHFGYDDKEVIVTGLCRWDALQDKSSKEEREILIMPTWRSWMDGILEEEFLQSSYYRNYVNLLQSNRLKGLLEKHGVRAHFLLHPKFIDHVDKFKEEDSVINIVQFGEVKVNELLMKTSMLITDYSSVAWEMYYQQKPTLFFQFDVDKYNKLQGSYMDMETELFGDRAMTVEELVQLIERYINNNFQQDERFVNMRSRYFKYIDKNNAERTFDIINENKSKLYQNKLKNGSLYTSLRSSRIAKKLWKISMSSGWMKPLLIRVRNVAKSKSQ